MSNSTLCVLLCAMPFVLGGARQPTQSTSVAPPMVKLHVVGRTHSPASNWYEDAFVHAVGDEVVALPGQKSTAKQRGGIDRVRLRCVRSKENDTLDFVVGSVRGAQTSGNELRFHFEHDASGTPLVRVTGSWKSDLVRPDRPSTGDLDDVRGDVYISSSDFGSASGLSVRFAVTTSWNSVPVVLMGGLAIPDP